MSKEIILYLDVNRVNRPFVQEPGEEGLFGDELARVKEIFELLGTEQRDVLADARGAYHNGADRGTTRVKAIENWSSGSNIVGIFGKRGSGKSSLMLSVKETLESDHERTEESRFIKEKTLSIWLDPALFMNNRLAEVFLAKLYGMFRNWSEDQCRGDAKWKESLQKRLHEAFQRVQQALGGLRNGDEKGASLRNLLLTAEAGTIQQNVFELVELMLTANGCEGGKMILFLDDFDLQERDVLNHLDDWKHYLNLPNVVVILSAAQEELEELLVEGRMKDRVELMRAGASNAMRSLSYGRPEIVVTGMPWLEKRELYDRAHAHLLKVVGPNRRVYLSLNAVSRATHIICNGERKEGDEMEKIEKYVSQNTSIELGFHFYQVSENQEYAGKFDFILNAWRDSSLREQVIALTQMRGTTMLDADSIIDASFSRSEIRRLEGVLPNTAKRLEFSSNVVRWITFDRNAKSGKSLRDFCEATLRVEFRSSWQAYLFINYMWRILGDEETGGAPQVNFLDVEPESDALFWGGGALPELSKLRGKDLASGKVSKAAKYSSFAADLMASAFWRSDEKADWKLQLLRPKLAGNPINAIPRLLLGADTPSFDTQYGDEEIQGIQQRFHDWFSKVKGSPAYEYLRKSLANPIFFSSLLAQFSKGSRRRSEGIPGFFEQLEKDLIANTLKVIALRWGIVDSGVWYLEMEALFRSHPLNADSPKCSLDSMVRKALEYNDEAKKSAIELNEMLRNWKRFVKYFYGRRDEFLPAAWNNDQDPVPSGDDFKKKARSLQVYLSRDVHKQNEGQPLPIYSELNRAIRNAGDGAIVEQAQRVYEVVQEYIKYSEKMVRELEWQIQDAESK